MNWILPKTWGGVEKHSVHCTLYRLTSSMANWDRVESRQQLAGFAENCKILLKDFKADVVDGNFSTGITLPRFYGASLGRQRRELAS